MATNRTTEQQELKDLNMRFRYFAGMNLDYRDLRQCDLSETCFFNSTFAYSRLDDSDLRDADLSGADLRHASLRGVNLCGANLSNIKYGPTDFEGVMIDDATELSSELRELLEKKPLH